MLGEFLHFKFFKNNENWYYKKKLKQKYGTSSLFDYRDFLDEVVNELELVNRGSLLSHPLMDRIIEQIEKND